jgi:hypothetical protein
MMFLLTSKVVVLFFLIFFTILQCIADMLHTLLIHVAGDGGVWFLNFWIIRSCSLDICLWHKDGEVTKVCLVRSRQYDIAPCFSVRGFASYSRFVSATVIAVKMLLLGVLRRHFTEMSLKANAQLYYLIYARYTFSMFKTTPQAWYLALVYPSCCQRGSKALFRGIETNKICLRRVSH